MITISEIMTKGPHTLPETASLQDAIGLMAEKHIRHIPIVNAGGALVGLISHRDVLAATDSRWRVQGERQDPTSIRLSDIMTRNVATVDEGADVRRAALYLEEHKYGCLPVVTDGQLAGIVTDTDFVAVAINLLEQLEMTEPPEEET